MNNRVTETHAQIFALFKYPAEIKAQELKNCSTNQSAQERRPWYMRNILTFSEVGKQMS